MKIYDISQELYGSVVFPSDPAPSRKTLASIKEGSLYNLTQITMCAHNGTHIDAPKHFIEEGKGIDEIALERVVGKCFVFEMNGEIGEKEALDMLERAKKVSKECAKRILIKGNAVLNESGANALKDKILLYGNESQTVGGEGNIVTIHRTLLKEEVVLLEGIRLNEVSEGEYFLFSAPVSLKGGDGSPCRAILVKP